MSLTVGTPAPDFTLKNQFGEDVTLSSFRGKKSVVIVFFPLAFSGICTGELCELRDNFASFQDKNVELLAISIDSTFVQRQYAEHEKYDFSLLSDMWPHGAVASQYGVFLEDKGFANRGTFVVGTDGNLVAQFITEPGQARDLSAYKAVLETL